MFWGLIKKKSVEESKVEEKEEISNKETTSKNFEIKLDESDLKMAKEEENFQNECNENFDEEVDSEEEFTSESSQKEEKLEAVQMEITSKEEIEEKNKALTDGLLFENRELSWLKFNQRVLEEAQNKSVPLCERMSFLSIYQTNLDEFFMVRVGSLEDQKLLKNETRENKTHMTPQEQIDAIGKRAKELNKIKDKCYKEVMDEVAENGIKIVKFHQISKEKEYILRIYFINEIMPLLSAMIVGRKQPFPFLKGGDIHALAILQKEKKDSKKKEQREKIGIVPCSSDVFPRLIKVPQTEDTYVLSEDLILHFIPLIFKGFTIKDKTLLRITRNADIDVVRVYDEDLNYRDQMAEIVKQRRKLAPIRLEMTRSIAPKVVSTICDYCKVSKKQVFFLDSPLEFSFLSEISDILRKNPKLCYPKRIPQPSPNINTNQSIIDQILEKDILLSYPYESIKPFLQLLQEAANDPKVISIRMTLYRLAKNSKIVEALVDAAENGKQVDVLVELKARFDEANNIEWSRTLEEAGCHVVYGLDGLKVHSKLLLITRKDEGKIEYITQIGTGNYNEKTSRLYTDLSLMTASKEIGQDASSVFQSMFLGETVENVNHLFVAPNCLQNRILDRIDFEISEAKAGREAYIGVKINSLTDKKIIDKLIDASMAGVHIDMLIRGINCLRTGVKGVTDNIHIYSIVGRYLEHSRIYIFGPESRDEIYIASADFMTRNTERRVEVAAPIYDENLKKRIRDMYKVYLSDNVKKRVQNPDGMYEILETEDASLNAQEYFFEEAYKAVNAEIPE